MRSQVRPVRALYWINVAGRPIPVLPLQSVVGLLIALALIFAAAYVMDRLVLPAVEQMGAIESTDWSLDNQRINQNNSRKNYAKADNPVWRSKGHPVSEIPSRPVRILVMGDSFVWGDGYANVNDVWWRRLQRELERRGFGGVEVIGAGLCGWSTRDQLTAAPTIVASYKPDLIIWGYVTNDPDEKVIKLTKPPESQSTEETSKNGALPHLAAQLDKAKVALVPESSDPTIAYTYNEWEQKLLTEPNLIPYRMTISELATYQKSTGLPGFVVTLPNAPNKDSFTRRYSPIAPLFESAGLTWVDTLPAFLDAYPGARTSLGGELQWGINPANGHPGTVSTHFYADQVSTYLQQNHADLLSRGRAPTPPTQQIINDWMPWNLDPAIEGDTITFAFPANDDKFLLTLPAGKPHVLLSFASPQSLTSVEISGPDLKEAAIYLTHEDQALGYDTGDLSVLEARNGTTAAWDLSGQEFARTVNTIRVHATFAGRNRSLTLRFHHRD